MPSKELLCNHFLFAFWNFLEILFFWVFLIYDLLNLLMWSPKIWRTNCSWDAESSSFWFTQSEICYLFCLTLKYMCIINYCPRLRENDSYFVIRNKLFSDLRFSWRIFIFFSFKIASHYTRKWFSNPRSSQGYSPQGFWVWNIGQ